MSERKYNRLLGLGRNAAALALVVVLLYLSRPRQPLLAAGLLAVVLGESIRFWAAGHLLKSLELVTSGPYRFTRNPLYLGRLLIFSGLCVMSNLPYGASWVVLLVGWAVFFGYYLPRKESVEPARLRALHGEAFDRYREAVPALFPSLRPYSDPSPGRWSSRRMLRNREHWMVIGLTAAALLLIWRAGTGVGV